MINTVVVEGFANRAKFGEFSDNTAWCNFTLRHSSYAGKDDTTGEAKYNASFIDVKARRWTAENAKGVIPDMDSDERAVRVIVSGELRQETWGDEGNKRYTTFILADSITLAEPMRSNTPVGAGASRNGAPSFGNEPF